MSETLPPEGPPPDLRFLKLLVTTLAGVMILGLVTIVVLLVIRLPAPSMLPDLPANLVLPEGATPAAVTFARDWLVVVTGAGDILLYERTGGRLIRQVTVE